MLREFLLRRVGENWGRAPIQTRNWWASPPLREHIDRQISAVNETGVIGAFREATGGIAVARGVSIGCGKAAKEMALVNAELVQNFDLYEISEERAKYAAQAAREAGFGSRMNVYMEDAFRKDPISEYDFVYWDHALHHMFDVEKALKWSIRALKPGGFLLVNDYIGPTRLQWRRQEVAFAREFLRKFGSELNVDPSALKHKTFLHRLRLMYKDPSEAPQSDRIVDVFKASTGHDMKLLGGTMIHLCARFITSHPNPGDHLFQSLIEWDLEALRRGMSHFGFGLWQKP
jgi:SAM-dependent methyltransferase